MSNCMKKLVSLLAVAVMAVSVFAGCGNTDDKGSSSTPDSSGSQQTESSSESSEEVVEFSYPITPAVDLTINYGASMAAGSAEENPYGSTIILSTATGVNLTSNGVSSGSTAEDFQLMLVSGDLPDIISNSFHTSYVGGAAAAIDDGHIISLSDYSEYMPNYLAWLEENPVYKSQVTTSDGRIWCFANVEQQVDWDRGIVLRKDVLDQLGLSVPVTVDDFYNVLKTVKEKTDMIPFSSELRWMWSQSMSSSISGAYDVCYPFYTTDGKTVKFAMYEDDMKAWLQTMNKWYSEGLIDPNFASVKKGDVRSGLANGTIFAANQQAVNSVTSMTSSTVEGAEYIAIPQLVLKKGDTSYNFNASNYKSIGGYNFSISTDCKNIEAAMRYCDFMFTEEGNLMYNYGTEGFSWEYDANGNIALTEMMTSDPDRSADSLRYDYAKVCNWAGVAEGALLYKTDLEKEFIEVFCTGLVEAGVNAPMTDEENSSWAEYNPDLDTYAQEVITNLIMGNESFDNWETIKNNFKNNYHADELLAVKQAAWDRFLAE